MTGGGLNQPGDQGPKPYQNLDDHAKQLQQQALSQAVLEQSRTGSGGPAAVQARGQQIPGQVQPESKDEPAKRTPGAPQTGDVGQQRGDQSLSEIGSGTTRTDIHDKVIETHPQFNPPPVNQANNTAFSTVRQGFEAEGKVPVTPVSVRTEDNQLIQGAMRGSNTLVTAHGEYEVRPNEQSNGFNLYKRNEQGQVDPSNRLEVRSMQPAQNPLDAHHQTEPAQLAPRPAAQITRVESQAPGIERPVEPRQPAHLETQPAARLESPQSARVEPLQAAHGEPLQTARVAPQQPARVETLQTARVEPSQTAHGEPLQTARVAPQQPTRVEPLQTARVEPSQTAHSEPLQTARVAPQQPARVEPLQTARVEPSQTAHGEPLQTARVAPQQPARVEPLQTARVEPSQTAHGEPLQTARVEPRQVTAPADTGLHPIPAAPRQAETQSPAIRGGDFLRQYGQTQDPNQRLEMARQVAAMPPERQAQFKSEIQQAAFQYASKHPEATANVMKDLSTNVEIARRTTPPPQIPHIEGAPNQAPRVEPSQPARVEPAPTIRAAQVGSEGGQFHPQQLEGAQHAEIQRQSVTPPAVVEGKVVPAAAAAETRLPAAAQGQPHPQEIHTANVPPASVPKLEGKQVLAQQPPAQGDRLAQPQVPPAQRIADAHLTGQGDPKVAAAQFDPKVAAAQLDPKLAAAQRASEIAAGGAPQPVAHAQDQGFRPPQGQHPDAQVAAAQLHPDQQLIQQGKDKTLTGTEGDRGRQAEIRSVDTAAQSPANASVRHVPLGEAQQDARVARPNADQTAKIPTAADAPGVRLPDASALRQTPQDIAAKMQEAHLAQQQGILPGRPGDALPGHTAAEIAAAKQGQVPDAAKLADRQLPPELAAKLMDASNKGLTPSEMMTRAQDVAGKIQQQQVEGIVKQAHEQANAGAILRGEVAKVGDAATVGRSLTDANVPTQRTTIPGLNMGEGQNRQFVNDVIKQLQTNRLAEFDPRATNLQNLLVGMDQGKITRLQAFLTNESAQTKTGTLTQEQMISRLNTVLSTGSDLTSRFGPGMRLDANMMTTLNQGRIDQTSPIALANLARMLEMINKPTDPTRPPAPEMGLKDMVGRNMTDTQAGQGLTLRLPPGQELTIKNIIDSKVLSTALPNVDLRTADGARKVDARPDIVDPKQVTRPEEKETRQNEREDTRTEVAHPTQHPPTDQSKKDDADIKIQDQLKDQAEKLKDQKEQHEERERELKRKEDEQHKRKLEEEEKTKRDMLTFMATQKLRQQKEKELKDKELTEQKKKEEDTKRRRYIVKDKDTLQSIALRQLRDVRLAQLIYQINRSVIPIAVQRGKKVHVLKVGQVILLPSGVEIRDFKARTPGLAPPPAESQKKLETAEDELASRFGANWDGKAEKDEEPGEEEELTAEAIAAAKTRRENVERLLGPVSKKKEGPETRIRYVVRLGDSLKSVALKHPALKDVDLWKLLAMVNGLPIDVDSSGAPTTALSRGSTLVIPMPAEVAEFKEHLAEVLNGDADPIAATETPAPASQAILEKIAAQPDAGTIILQAAGFIPEETDVQSDESADDDDYDFDDDDETSGQ